MECAAVAKHLARRHEVLVLTSGGYHRSSMVSNQTPEGRNEPAGSADAPARTQMPGDPSERAGSADAPARTQTRGDPSEPAGSGDTRTNVEIRRELPLLTPDARGALRAPLASLGAVGTARHALAWRPDLIYAWNGVGIPQVALRVFADSGVPLAFRVAEHWFKHIFVADQFLRELRTTRRGPARAMWAAGCRAFNALPALRVDPEAPLRTAISWNSEATRRIAQPPHFVEAVLERVAHPAPPHGDLYAAIERQPAAEPRIVFLGRVTPYKGPGVAIEALALLRSKHGVPATLEVVGPEEGDHGAELRLLADRLGVAAAVRWRGQATPEQVANVLARAHALIVPSTWEEPFGLVMVEGALARVPLVASDVGGIGESMRNEEHALLFPRADAGAAATALARTLNEREATAARVRRAYDRAQAFRVGPYLDEQERFVYDALEALQTV
jgi:glycosyltransferase involved in cell wall biosynthesis